MEALDAVATITRARHLDLADDRHHAARVRPLVGLRASVGAQHGLGDRPRTPLIQVGLQQAAQHFAAFDLQQRSRSLWILCRASDERKWAMRCANCSWAASEASAAIGVGATA